MQNMSNLYFYKLVSPYREDVTKDCKLTVNEIDHNFLTLKDADIKEVSFDKDKHMLILTRNNNEKLMVEVPTYDFDVEFDGENGVLTIVHGSETFEIDGLITDDNLGKRCIIDEVNTDGSLVGAGNNRSALRLSSLEKTGVYRPALKVIDFLKGEKLPSHEEVKIWDRFVTHESVSEYGYLYNFKSVKKIQEDLKNGWRIPTKSDWDNMLNAIEPCDADKNHNEKFANKALGFIAGKLLKSFDFWDENFVCESDKDCACDGEHCKGKHPSQKKIDPKGNDAFGMKILPSGFNDGCDVADYFSKRGYFWSSTMIDETDVYLKRFDNNKAKVVQTVESPRSYFSLRLVKDYNGCNHHEVEHINGMDYKTVLLPSENAEKGYSIWTAENIAFNDPIYHPLAPNGQEEDATRLAYFINDWNGFKWVKKEIHEGEKIVLFEGLNDDEYAEYQLVHGELISVLGNIHDKVVEEVVKEIGDVIGSGFTEGSITDVLKNEIARSTSAETALKDSIDAEKERAELEEQRIADNVDEIASGLTSETERAIEAETELFETISQISGSSEELKEAIEAEVERATSAETALGETIEEESERAKEAEETLQEAIEDVNSQLISGGTYNDVVDGERNGVLTLEKNDGSVIEIDLNSDYGIFPMF